MCFSIVHVLRHIAEEVPGVEHAVLCGVKLYAWCFVLDVHDVRYPLLLSGCSMLCYAVLCHDGTAWTR